jgi:hypothetical protein
METIITIKKNKAAFRTLISLAKELEKKDTSISVREINETEKLTLDIIPPKSEIKDISDLLSEISDFPTLKQLRKKAWPTI